MKIRQLGKRDGVAPARGNSNVWRYFGLEKFLSLLMREGLWFSISSSFEDKYESHLAPGLVAQFERRGVEPEQIEQFKTNYREMRDKTYVSCWSMTQHESFAMWRVFLADPASGVAIKSKVSRVRNSLKSSLFHQEIKDAKVTYTNRQSASSSVDQLVTTKTRPFSYESEYRLFFFGGMLSPFVSQSSLVGVDLDTLVEEIVVSPYSPRWFEEAVVDLVGRYQPLLKERVRRSSIELV